MSGVAVVRAILAAHQPLTDVVRADRIVSEDLPMDVELPAISILTVSSVDRKVLKGGSTRRVTDRVQVNILANDATERLLLIGLVRQAGADKIGNFDEVTEVSLTTEGQGPDLTTETGIRMRSQDFLVAYNEAT